MSSVTIEVPSTTNQPASQQASRAPTSQRIREIDALRGLAALAVVVFHYTNRFDAIFGLDAWYPGVCDYGFLGVHIFFVISGFVIMMTLERTRTAADFAVSRFSRLYPTFWICVTLTFVITTVAGLEERQVDWSDAIVNLTMLHNFLGFPPVDGVYWTLTWELCFYLMMSVLYFSGATARLKTMVAAMIVFQMTVEVVKWRWQLEFANTVNLLLLTRYFHLFFAGVLLHRLTKTPNDRLLYVLLLALFGVAAYRRPADLVGISVATFSILAVIRGYVPWLASPGLLFLGAVSYPLYLLHSNIGMIMIRDSRAVLGEYPAILSAIGLSLLLAYLVHRWVEVTSVKVIRNAWIRAKQQPS